MKSKNALTIYLIKKEYMNLKKILKDKSWKEFELENGTCYLGETKEKTPRWTNFFVNQINFSHVLTMSSKAVFVLEVDIEDETRMFALTMGYGRGMLNLNSIEENFGLKTVLNIVKPNTIKRINKINIGGNQKQSNEQVVKRTDINEFGLDFNRDIVSTITGYTEMEPIKGNVTGKDALSCAGVVDIRNIKTFLKKLYMCYISDDYKKNFAWIDQIRKVKSKDLCNKLNNKMIELINEKSNDVWMAVPEVIEWSTIRGFRYKHKSENIYDDVYIRDFLSEIGEQIDSFEKFKKFDVEMVGEEDDNVKQSWKVWKCIYGEIKFEGYQYCVSNGDWYCIDNDYVKELEIYYDKTPKSNIEFDDYDEKFKGEGQYNEFFAKKHKDACILMDKANIQYADSHSKVELCDVLMKSGQLVHVKKYGGSSLLSHLFEQGMVSGELIKLDIKFLEKANKKIEKQTGDDSYKLSKDKGMEIVFAIISKDVQSKPHLPFFSKIAFRHARQRLEAQGYKVTIGKIYNKQ